MKTYSCNRQKPWWSQVIAKYIIIYYTLLYKDHLLLMLLQTAHWLRILFRHSEVHKILYTIQRLFNLMHFQFSCSHSSVLKGNEANVPVILLRNPFPAIFPWSHFCMAWTQDNSRFLAAVFRLLQGKFTVH